MRHQYVLECVYVCLSNLWSIVSPKFLGLLEQYSPYPLGTKGGVCLLKS